MLELEIVKGLKDSEIRQIMLDRGYTIKDGQDDLKPYVYQSAYDIEAITMKKWRDVVRRQNRLIDSLTKKLPVQRTTEKTSDVDCSTCANLGKVNGLSQDTYCQSCKWSESWRTDNYAPNAKLRRPPETD